MEVVGLDIGFGFTKATTGSRRLVFKSVIGEAADVQYTDGILEDRADDDHLHLEFDDKSLFIGELAERQSNMRSFTLDQNQFIAEFAKTLGLAALSQLVDGTKPVHLVTGLPILNYRANSAELARLLKGKHAFTVVGREGRHEVVLDIADVRVIPQPFGSMYNLMLSDNGDVGDRRMISEKIAIVDVGFQTADYTIADRRKYLERGSRTTDSGIARAFTAIATKIREKSGVNVELYRLYEAVERGSIKVRGNTFDLRRLTEQVFGQLATDVATEANELWADEWDIDSIAITGGGGAVLAPYLTPLINGRVLPVESNVDSRFRNVTGYLKYGKHLWQRPAGSSRRPAGQEPAEAPAEANAESEAVSAGTPG